MNLSTESWYARWFFWSCRVRDRFFLSPQKRDYHNSEHNYRLVGTNLCQFFRVLLIGVIITALTLGMYGYIAFVLLILPFLLFKVYTLGTILLTIIGILCVAAAFVGLIFGIVVGTGRTFRYLHDRNAAQPTGEPSFWGLVLTYLMAIKQRFCPTIKFSGPIDD